MMWQIRIQELAAKVADTDYGSPDAVAEHNAASDEIRELVRLVGCSSTADLDELLSLLSDEMLRDWVAYGVLDECPTTAAQRERCAHVICELAEGDGPDALAAECWLRDNDNTS